MGFNHLQASPTSKSRWQGEDQSFYYTVFNTTPRASATSDAREALWWAIKEGWWDILDNAKRKQAV